MEGDDRNDLTVPLNNLGINGKLNEFYRGI